MDFLKLISTFIVYKIRIVQLEQIIFIKNVEPTKNQLSHYRLTLILNSFDSILLDKNKYSVFLEFQWWVVSASKSFSAGLKNLRILIFL